MVLQSFLLLSGDVELIRDQNATLATLFLNLNSISAHNDAKVFLLKAYIAIHKSDITCISETHLDSSTSFDDSNLKHL